MKIIIKEEEKPKIRNRSAMKMSPRMALEKGNHALIAPLAAKGADVSNIANTLRESSRFAELEPLERYNFDVLKRKLGEEHPRTSTHHSRAKRWMSSMGNWSKNLIQKQLRRCRRPVPIPERVHINNILLISEPRIV